MRTIFACLAWVAVLAAGAWAQTPPRTLRVVYTDYAPFAFRNAEGEPAGFSIDILRELARRRGIDLTFDHAPDIGAALEAVKRGAADVLPALAATPGRAELLQFTTPIAQSVIDLYARAATAAFHADGDHGGARIAYTRGSATQALVLAIPGALPVQFATNRDSLVALAAGEVDLAVMGRAAYAHLARQMALQGEIVAVGPALRRLDLSIAISIHDSGMVQELNGAISDLLLEPLYRQTHDFWFGAPPSYWSTERVLIGAALVLALVVALAGGVVWIERDRARRVRLAETEERERLAVGHAQALADKNRHLEHKNAELETLFRVVSHDLRSPMVTVRGFAELLDDALGSGDLAQAADASRRILRSTRRLADITDDMIDISRIERTELDLGLVDLAEIYDSVRHLLDQQLQAAQATLILTGSVYTFVADPRKATRVILNLVTNAILHGCPSPGMAIELSASQRTLADGGVATILCVRDEGPGIAPQHHLAIFELFRRLPPLRDAGTGLGLAIVEKIAQKHGGRAWVESRPGEGAAFFVEFAAAGQGARAA